MNTKQPLFVKKYLQKSDKHKPMNATNVNPLKNEKVFRYLQDVEKQHIYFLDINGYIFDLLGLLLF